MRRTPAVAKLALAIAVLSACSEDPADTPTSRESSAPTADPTPALACPERLAQASSATNGFGSRTSASTVPSLSRPTAAIVCAYSADIAKRNADGAQIQWKRVGDAVTLTTKHLAPIAADLAALKPPPKSYGCDADLGPRWLLMYRSESGVVGVVADDFGCRFVRLTTDPANIVAGEDPAPGLVQGVLFGPRFFEQRLNVIAGQQLKSR